MWQTKNQGLEERERERAHGASTATEGDVVEEMTVRHGSPQNNRRTNKVVLCDMAHTQTQCQDKKEREREFPRPSNKGVFVLPF